MGRVVAVPTTIGLKLRLGDRPKPARVQQFGSHATVERFDVRVLRRLSGLNIEQLAPQSFIIEANFGVPMGEIGLFTGWVTSCAGNCEAVALAATVNAKAAIIKPRTFIKLPPIRDRIAAERSRQS